MVLANIDLVENRRRMLAGELYSTVAPDLIADRDRCRSGCKAFNTVSTSGEAMRKQQVEAWKT